MSQFDDQRYIVLETFREGGSGVKTTVWFVEEEGKLYIWTLAASGKIRRIRKNPLVRVSPSSVRGIPRGTWVQARATVLDESKSRRSRELIRQKYGFQFWVVNLLRGKHRCIVELTPLPKSLL